MNLISTKNYQELSARAGEKVIGRVAQDPACTLVLPTGNTPLGMYAELVSAYQNGIVSFDACRLVELDDYFQIPLADPRNLFNWLNSAFLSQVDLAAARVVRFNTAAADPVQECRRVEDQLAAWGGIDLAVLGLGSNGHLGFNEPGSDPTSRTRIITLSAASITSSGQYWGSEEAVPRQGITLGLGTLLAAREILLLVSGIEKSAILKAALQGPITAELPASFLQDHPNLTIIADENALGEL